MMLDFFPGLPQDFNYHIDLTQTAVEDNILLPVSLDGFTPLPFEYSLPISPQDDYFLNSDAFNQPLEYSSQLDMPNPFTSSIEDSPSFDSDRLLSEQHPLHDPQMVYSTL